MDMKKMMKQAQKMQRDAAAAQEEIAQMEFTASAGGGMVEAVVMGDNTLKSVKIDPDAVDPEDVEMLEDMIVAAVNEGDIATNHTIGTGKWTEIVFIILEISLLRAD